VASGKDVILDPAIFGNNDFRGGIIDRFLNLLNPGGRSLVVALIHVALPGDEFF
jgi:hypothetical protein